MSGFKPTGYGPKAGFQFPASFGFTGSTGAYTNVSPYVRQKPRAFKDGGYVSKVVGDQGHAAVQRDRPYTSEDQEYGGRGPLRRGFKDGGKFPRPSSKHNPNPMKSAKAPSDPMKRSRHMKDGGKNWIAGAIKHPGALHQALHVPAGEKIPAKKLNKAAHSDNPTMRRRAALAKTLGKMHKADGGAVPGALSDREREYLRRSSPNRSMSSKQIDDMLRKAMPKKPTMPATGMKGKFAAADGGQIPRRVKDYSVMEGLRDIPALAREGVDYVRRSMSAGRRAAGERGRSIMEETSAAESGKTMASNYKRGGKVMKRQMGGPAMGYAPMASRVVSATPMAARPMMMPMRGRSMMRSKGGMTRYADGGEVSKARETSQRRIAINKYWYDQADSPSRKESVQYRADQLGSPNHRVNLKTTKIKPFNPYAKGGAVHSDEAQDRKMIGAALRKHVSTPAPKGHKGLGEMCK